MATQKWTGATLSTANSNLDGTGTLATLYTAPSGGCRIEQINIKATGTTTSGMIRIFKDDGTNKFLVWEEPVSAATPSATVAAFSTSIRLPNLFLQNGTTLKASTEKAETFKVVTEATEF